MYEVIKLIIKALGVLAMIGSVVTGLWMVQVFSAGVLLIIGAPLFLLFIVGVEFFTDNEYS